MSSNEIRVLGDLELSGALSFGKNFNDFPVDPKPRTIIIKQGQAYMYTELVNGSGFYTWQPIGVKQTSYLHTQGVASTVWTVTHNFNSNDFVYFVYDNNHRLVVANIEIVDANTARILLSEAMTGTAVFFSVQYVSAPAINAAESITVKTLTLRDASGVLTINNNIVAMEESVAARFAQVYTATQTNSAITTEVSAEAVLRAAADEALGARIDAVLSNIDAGALDSLTELLAAFQSADSNLNSAITALGASSTSALAAEVTARQAAVTGAIATASADATAKVLAEANIRSANDATVLTQAEGYADTKVAAEATARATAVTSAIATAASDATSKVAVETAARISNDAATLASGKTYADGIVTAEATTRSTADTANLATAKSYADSAVAAEAELRVSNDALSVTAAKAYSDAQLALEVIARTSADAATLASGKTYADGIVATEATARSTAVTAEATARAAADVTTLASAKTYADSQITATLSTLSSSVNSASSSASDYTDTKIAAEVQARLAGDETNATAISTEATARATAVTGAIATAAMDATSKVATEATARTAAITTVTNNLTAETGRAQTAEAALTSSINAEATARTAADTAAIASSKTYTDGAIVPAVQAYLGAVTADIIPAVNLVGNLGSPTHQFHSLYVGPGTLYVNGKAVIQDNSDTITFSTDPDQNLRIETKGNGHLQLQTGLGTIDVNSTLTMQTGKRITDSAGIQVEMGNALQMNSNKILGVGTPTVGTDGANKTYVDGLTTGDSSIVRTSGIQNINGVKTFVDGIVVQGDFTVTGTTTTINSVTLKIADNLIDLNSDFTAGTATENAGIRVMRGDEPATQVRWNESGNKWELTNDGATYSSITTASDLAAKSTALTGDVVGTGTGSISTVLSATSVTAGSYGTAGSVGTFTVDAKGRITGAATTAISITNSQVSDFATGVRALHSAGTGITYTASTGAIAVDSTIATKVYADASAATSLASGKTYADGIVATEVTARNTAIAAADVTTLASGKTYADGIVATEATARNTAIAAGNAATLVSAQSFATTADGTNLTAAEAYADTQDATNLTAAKAYTDTVAATASGVTVGTYGNAATVPTIVVNAQGKITSVSSNTISVTSESVTDFVETAQDAAAALFTSGSHPGLTIVYSDAANKIDLSLTASGVTAATYGSTTTVPAITVAADGRITSAASTAIAFPVTSVAGKTGAVTLAVADVTGAASTTYVDTNAATTLASAKTYTDTSVANLVASSPAALDTLNELSAALGNDANFATTISNSIGTKAASAITISAGTGLTGGGNLTANRTLALATSGVTAGTYNSVTVDTYGRVTSGSAAVAATTLTTSSVVIDGFGTIDTAALTTSAVTAGQVLDSNSITAVRTVKYTIQATSGTTYQSVEMLLIQDGTNVSIVEYANVSTNGDLAEFDADISGGNVRLLVTPANAATVFKVMKTTVGV